MCPSPLQVDTYLEYPLLENDSPTSHLSRRSQPDAYYYPVNGFWGQISCEWPASPTEAIQNSTPKRSGTAVVEAVEPTGRG